MHKDLKYKVCLIINCDKPIKIFLYIVFLSSLSLIRATEDLVAPDRLPMTAIPKRLNQRNYCHHCTQTDVLPKKFKVP